MDLREIEVLPDTQAQIDGRGLAVDRAGIRGLRLPARIVDVDGTARSTVATFDLGVTVPAAQRGTHMSRLAEAAHDLARNLSVAQIDLQLPSLLRRLAAPGGAIEVRYAWFIEKSAPRSARPSLLDVDVTLRARRTPGGPLQLEQIVRVPITSLCPCSKSISRYGAHNQRSYVSVTLRPQHPVAVARLVDAIERHASCAVYAVLKREDEKYVTEAAYENAKFAEDLVRDIFSELARAPDFGIHAVETENDESIHNHLAYARLRRAQD